ncbi:PREDICTED: uncharacterized protein LOC101296045 [Fragaria vesca subsp. vesca]|uniref:uncharacterized protein LOC101296045 n=1 Tax=Fragaria vesca subsp. vesca TaxID=101020 RepID=UPI0002C360E3|nr:PREDICTED: uncharacterized protein LOC101296045 [Fragaria vesca subsp. vesca]
MGGTLVLSTLVISVVLLLNQSSVFVSGLIPGEVTVHMANNLLPTEQELTVHCQSGDDDLGIQNLPYLADYQFKFHINVGDTTLFFCNFEWLNTTTSDYQTVSGKYDIYVAKRDEYRCGTYCNWRIQEEGLFSYNDNPDAKYWERLYTWPGHTI